MLKSKDCLKGSPSAKCYVPKRLAQFIIFHTAFSLLRLPSTAEQTNPQYPSQGLCSKAFVGVYCNLCCFLASPWSA